MFVSRLALQLSHSGWWPAPILIVTVMDILIAWGFLTYNVLRRSCP